MFEHVVNSVYIPSDDVISHRLDEFGALFSLQFYGINSVGLSKTIAQQPGFALYTQARSTTWRSPG